MLSRILIGVVSAAGAAVIAVPGSAWADPEPPPPVPVPDVNSYPSQSPVDYKVMEGWYAFSTPEGLTCMLQRGGAYGCNGPIPGAPGGANLVSGSQSGAPAFSSTDRPILGVNTAVKSLPPNTRLSFGTVSCGNDGAGATICSNSFDQSGFVVSPLGSFIIDPPPLGNGSGPFGGGFG
jgi:hypothetical protein